MQKQGACGSRFLLCKGRDQHRRGGAGQQAVFLSCRVGSLTGRKHTKAGLRRLWTLVSTMEWSESSYGVLSIILAEADENCHRLTLSMIGDFPSQVPNIGVGGNSEILGGGGERSIRLNRI